MQPNLGKARSVEALVSLDFGDRLDVEGLQAVGLQVRADEDRDVVQALADVLDRVARQAVHRVVVPNLRVQLHQALGVHLAVHEEILILVLLQVPLVDVDRQDDRTRCYHRRPVFEELGVVALELADLVGHVVNCFVEVVVQDAQITLHGLDGSREVEVEAEHLQNVVLQVDQLLLAHELLFVLGQQVYHSSETWRNGLF